MRPGGIHRAVAYVDEFSKERKRGGERESSVAAWRHHTTTIIVIIIVTAANYTDSCLFKSPASYYDFPYEVWAQKA